MALIKTKRHLILKVIQASFVNWVSNVEIIFIGKSGQGNTSSQRDLVTYDNVDTRQASSNKVAIQSGGGKSGKDASKAQG